MFEIVYQDESLLAVNKPTRLLTVPGRGLDKQDCLYHRVLESCPDALVVHRLDMDTSGLILFARTPEAQRNLSAQFENRRINKVYVAIVEGIVKQDKGVVDYPLRKDMEQRLPPKHVVDCVRGKKAITEWRVIYRGEKTTRVGLYPHTGRSHQLRVHMKSIGHPVVGDLIYGRSGERLMLHAESLSFSHPLTGESILLECRPPF